MYRYKDENNETHSFDEINDISKKIIETKKLIEITEKEYNQIEEVKNEKLKTKTLERQELLEAQELTDFYEKFQKLIELGVIQW